jgi:hypothetical protein
MADIFISYTSSDRPRAEKLKSWFEEAGWTTWIDREIGLGHGWEEQVRIELDRARVVVVLWGAEARRSEWVQREATLAHQSGRLLQIHATGLPLLPPFDTIQAVRMQSWSGETGHSERVKLLLALASRLNANLAQHLATTGSEEDVTAYHPETSEALELAFYYCARQVERARLQLERGYGTTSDFDEIGRTFSAMIALLRTDPEISDDREGVMHRLMDDFLNQLLLLVPDPAVLR